MKIVNIDAPQELVELILEKDIPVFVMSFVKSLEHVFYHDFQNYQNIDIQHFTPSPVWKFENGRCENIAVLLHSIPIYLRNDDTRPIHYQEQYDEKRVVDPLGAYICRHGLYTPYIELYLTKIFEAAEKFYNIYKDNNWLNTKPAVKEGFKLLLTKVLFHELAHAALDIFNLETTPLSEAELDVTFSEWREESLANAVALRIIKDKCIRGNSNDKIYNYVKTFMQKMQPEEYALGVLMEEFDADDFNSVFEAKIKGVDPTLQQEWLDYVQGKTGTPLNWNGLKAWNAKINSTF